MKVLGIIAEYNPFHNGHLFQLKKSIDMIHPDYVIAVISGNFTQRGEPALLSKWHRAEIAVRCGIDAVFELPAVFACNNAEYFAKGAIEIFNRLGCVTHLSFGSESGDLSSLSKLAGFLSNETPDFQEALKQQLSLGQSYPKARAEAVKNCLGENSYTLLASPNNILAIEYLKQLISTDSDITPITVKRYSAAYHSTELTGHIASATAIRAALLQEKNDINHFSEPSIKAFLPNESAAILSEHFSALGSRYKDNIFAQDSLLAQANLFKILSAKILTSSISELKEIFSSGEGLENKLKSEIRHCNDLKELKEGLLSKRYTATRINRLLIHLLLGLTKSDFHHILEQDSYYARILAFNKNGAALIKKIKNSEKAAIPCITNVNKEKDSLVQCQLLLSYDLLSTDLYNLLFNRNLYLYSDQLQKPYKFIE